MTINTESITALITAVADHARTSGKFERVNGHEAKNAPGNGLSAAVWLDRMLPYAARSGLSSTTVVLVLTVRVYTSAFSEPLDAMDPNLLDAGAWLMAAYSGDFELAGALSGNVDLLGASGVALSGRAGYQTIDSKVYRVWTIDVPFIVNDAFDQAA